MIKLIFFLLNFHCFCFFNQNNDTKFHFAEIKKTDILNTNDTINCLIGYRSDTSRYGHYFYKDGGDQYYNHFDCYLINNQLFTDTAFSINEEQKALLMAKQTNSGSFVLFSEKYKKRKIKSYNSYTNSRKGAKKFKAFKGYQFFLFKVKLVVNHFTKTLNSVYVWPSNDKNLTVLKSGMTCDVLEILELESVNASGIEGFYEKNKG